MGVLYAKVMGQWVVAAAPAPEEVVIHVDDPIVTYPDAELWYDPDAVYDGEVFVGWPAPTNAADLWVDTSTVPPSLKANIGGQWVEIAGTNEVVVGNVDPLPTNSTVELWFDTTVPPGTLYANVAGVWTPVTFEEVTVGDVDPITTNPAGELWYDTAGTTTAPAGVGRLKVNVGGQWVEAAPEEVWVGPDDPLVLGHESTELWFNTAATPILLANVGGMWVPVTEGNEVIVDEVDPYSWNPDSTEELWYKPTTRQLSVRVGGTTGAWEPLLVNEVWVESNAPLDPNVELWYDTNGMPSGGMLPLPAGGKRHQSLVKTTDDDGDAHWEWVIPMGGVPDQAVVKASLVDGDVKWDGPFLSASEWLGPYLQLIGGTVTGLTEFDAQVNFDGHVYLNNTTYVVGQSIIRGHHINVETDGYGVMMNGGAAIYKRSGGGIVIREHSGGTQPAIENSDGSNRRDIIDTTNGDARYALKTEIPPPASGFVTPDWNSSIVINASTDSNTNHFYVDDNGSANPLLCKVLEGRTYDHVFLWCIKSNAAGVSGGQPEGRMEVYVNGGDDGVKPVGMFKVNESDGQRVYYNHDFVSATHFDDRSSLATKDNVVPLDPSVASTLIDALQPITFTRKVEPGEGASEVGRNRPPIPLVSIAIEDIEASGVPIIRHLVHGTGDDRGYSIGGMLSVALAEIKSLRARVAQLEAS